MWYKDRKIINKRLGELARQVDKLARHVEANDYIVVCQARGHDLSVRRINIFPNKTFNGGYNVAFECNCGLKYQRDAASLTSEEIALVETWGVEGEGTKNEDKEE